MNKNFISDWLSYLPGIALCLLISLSANFLSEHYAGPKLLYALFICLSFHFLISRTNIKRGVDF